MDNVLSSRIFGLDNFLNLKRMNYGNGKMASFSEIIDEVYSAFKEKDSDFRRELVRFISSQSNSFFGDTAIIYRPEFVCVIDRVEIGNFGLLINEDKTRKVDHNYKIGGQRHSELARNSLLIALANGKERAEKVAEMAGYSKFDPLFLPLSKDDIKSIEVRFPRFFIGEESKRIYIYGWDDVYSCGYALKSI